MNFFSIFSIENKLFTENVKKGVYGNEPNGRTVQPTQLIRISTRAKLHALQNYTDFFFEFHLSFRAIHFFQENYFLPKKLKFQTV